MAVRVEVALNRFPELASTFDAAVERALDAGVQVCIATADPLTPVDTGLLRANKSITAGPGVRTITWNQHYAAYQEFGTSRGVSAKRFAATGADAAAPVIAAELGGFGT